MPPELPNLKAILASLLVILLIGLSHFLPIPPALADTTVPRYRVYTYPWIGNDPYQKTATDNLNKARSSYNGAKDFNYTAVLFDEQQLKFTETFTSSSAPASDALSKVTPILDRFTGNDGQVFQLASEALNALTGENDSLAKALKLALSDVEFEKEQVIFVLSALSNAVSSEDGTQNQLQQKLESRIRAAFSDPKVQEHIGNWELVWGPVVYERPQSVVSNNTLYVARNGNQYAIATAGTNPASLYDWLVEDADVQHQVDWPYQAHIPAGLQPQLAQGTQIGLDTLLQMQSGDQTLVEFLRDEVMAKNEQGIDLVVTGHSLGGALSPTLALNLFDREAEWTYNHPVNLSVHAYAGPTPGNADFATYYDQRLGANTSRVWNQIDIVPHAWEEDLLQQIPHLYEPQIPYNELIALAVSAAETHASAGNYQQLLPAIPGLQGTVQVPLPDLSACKPSDSTPSTLKLAVDSPRYLDTDAAAAQIAERLSPALIEAAKRDPAAAAQLSNLMGTAPSQMAKHSVRM